MHERKAVVIHNDDDFSATTILKPMSEEYLNYLYVICEDAYGEFNGNLVPKTDLKAKLNYNDDDFDKLLKKL